MQQNGYFAEDGSWAHACYVVAEQSILMFWLVVVVIIEIGMGITLRVASYSVA